MEVATGIPNIVQTARAMGVTTLGGSPASYSPSMTLGTYPVPTLEMAQAATVLANSGVLHPARFIISATLDGRALRGTTPAAKRVVDPSAAFIMNTILSNDANRVMEFGAHGLLTLPGHRVAAKTGTSENFKDNFTVGWTPQLATATWVGNADDSAMQGTTGITGAAPIWHQVMAHALTGVTDHWPAMPAGLTTASTAWGTAYFMPGTDATTGKSALVPSEQPGAPGPSGPGTPARQEAPPPSALRTPLPSRATRGDREQSGTLDSPADEVARSIAVRRTRLSERSGTLADDPFGGRHPTSHERMTGLPWDASYHDGPAPWDLGRPQPAIVRLASEGGFAGAVLDAGCGTGENALHVASLGLRFWASTWPKRHWRSPARKPAPRHRG